MHVSAARFTFLLIAALTTAGPGLAADQGTWGAPATAVPGGGHHPPGSTAQTNDTPPGSVRGRVVDPSAGVLPGVTVVATSVGGRRLETTTGATGEFAFDGLHAGQVDLSFHLDGFDDSRTRVMIPDGQTAAVSRETLVHRMELITRTESVVVRGDPPPPPSPPRPVLAPVPAHDQASVCGPAKAEGAVPSFGTIRSRRDDETKVLFAEGDELLIDGGTSNGLGVGQHFVVRRRYPTALRLGRNLFVMGEHSSGLLQIVAVDDQVSTAVVVYACDEMMRGDYLAPFEPQPIQEPEPFGKPAFDMAAKILFADAGQPLGVTGRMMIIDRGSRQDVRPGQRFTLFRRSRFGDARPLVVGEAVVVSVRTDSATIRVEHATDAIFFGDRGDWAAPHRPASRASN
jgi:hypothetical protein